MMQTQSDRELFDDLGPPQTPDEVEAWRIVTKAMHAPMQKNYWSPFIAEIVAAMGKAREEGKANAAT